MANLQELAKTAVKQRANVDHTFTQIKQRVSIEHLGDNTLSVVDWRRNGPPIAAAAIIAGAAWLLGKYLGSERRPSHQTITNRNLTKGDEL